MNNSTTILNFLELDNLVKGVNGKDLSANQFHFINKEVKEKIQIDGVYFSGNYASIFFKNITDFNAENLKEICNIHKSIWNQRKVPFLYVSTPTELRVYNCFKEPINPETELVRLKSVEIKRYSVSDTNESLQELISIFGRVSIDSGEIWKTDLIAKHFKNTKRVDEKLVQNLKETKIRLERAYNLPDDIIHNLLTRSLFILYLEDIRATENLYYQKFKKGATSYFDILTDADSTYKLFKEFEKKFNGDLFAISDEELKRVNNGILKLVSDCFWGHEVDTRQQILWKVFDFSIIPIELLSEIYEIFLNKTDISRNGEYYTPHSLVDLILNESLPWADEKNSKYDLKVLDIACGSGIFLVESYRRLVDRWIYANNKQPRFQDLENILLTSIFGFEVNHSSIKVASFSLYLALISYLDPKTIWQQKATRFPNLIFDPKQKDNAKQGKNLFLQSSLTNTIEHQPEFDLVIGNPPFKSAKTGTLNPEIKEYCKRFGFAQEMVLPFLHRATDFVKDNGKISLVSTSKILFNKSGGYQKFRKFLFNENNVEIVINFSTLRKAKKGQGKNIFSNAVGPSCVLFYQKNRLENPKETITYVCPKPTRRDYFSDSLVLDELDFFFLPRNECEKPDTIIWKVGMWGTENDFLLINNLHIKSSLNSQLLVNKEFVKAKGLQFLTEEISNIRFDEEINKLKIIDAKYINRFYTPIKSLQEQFEVLTDKNKSFYRNLPKISNYRRLGNKNVFFAPHILIKEGQSNKQFCASFINYNCCFKSTVTGIALKKSTTEEHIRKLNILKALTAYFNSKFASYFLFLTSISWGVERERVTTKDLLELPALPFEIPEEKINQLAQKVDEISEELAKDFPDEYITKRIENEINEIIYQTLNLTDREKYLIEDVLNYSIDLFQEGERSAAYRPINQNNDELKEYLKILCEDINEHLEFLDTSVWASIQEMPVTNPMRLVAIHFTDEFKAGHIKVYRSKEKVNSLIYKIDRYSYQINSASVYFRKIMKYYDGDTIYIIKPNQKRFWSRSQAMADSNSILLEMANMNGE